MISLLVQTLLSFHIRVADVRRLFSFQVLIGLCIRILRSHHVLLIRGRFFATPYRLSCSSCTAREGQLLGGLGSVPNRSLDGSVTR